MALGYRLMAVARVRKGATAVSTTNSRATLRTRLRKAPVKEAEAGEKKERQGKYGNNSTDKVSGRMKKTEKNPTSEIRARRKRACTPNLKSRIWLQLLISSASVATRKKGAAPHSRRILPALCLAAGTAARAQCEQASHDGGGPAPYRG
jgi:hypothetical protein